MNKVILCGRLTRDPDVRYSQGPEQICTARYTLAVDRRNANKDSKEQSADVIPCIAFRRNGEFAERWLRQGTKIMVTGRIQTGSYTNREGQKVYTTDVIVEEQEFAESKGAQNGAVSSAAAADADGFMQIPDSVDDEGLPFS
ncbi:MAG: single-stranded DNA-binding protein [Lachnospiraceae bacterium]|nr:single-stranded DNA-binding protein [Lachnospiraceae bacterium]